MPPLFSSLKYFNAMHIQHQLALDCVDSVGRTVFVALHILYDLLAVFGVYKVSHIVHRQFHTASAILDALSFLAVALIGLILRRDEFVCNLSL